MIASFLIMFRESLEAALIVGIMLSYLIRTKQEKYNNIVYLGIVAGLVGSVIGAIAFVLLAGGFEGRSEQIFEGTTMLLGAVLLTSMILWMMKQKYVVKELEQKVASEVGHAHKIGLFMLVFLSVLREGIETVIFLAAASFVSSQNNIIGALLGLIVAITMGYAIFVTSMKVNIKKYFNITSFILIFFAAGLVAHGVHEFEEARLIPGVVEHVFDINPSLNADGSYPLLHENGTIGSFFRELLGYNGNPSLLELISYLGYLVVVFFLWKRTGFAQKNSHPDAS